MNGVVWGLLGALVVLLWRNYRRDARRRLATHAGVFDACMDLFQQPLKSADMAGLPVLRGEYAGYRVALSIVEDTIAWRKIPPLWLLVKVEANAPSQGTLDLIVRPANNEFYSPAWQWDGTLDIPPRWPQHAIVKYRRQAANLAALESHVPALFADTSMKELLVTPAMVRLTWMIKQADRGEYLIMRNAIYNDSPLERQAVEHLLQQAVAIRGDLERMHPTHTQEAIHEYQYQ